MVAETRCPRWTSYIRVTLQVVDPNAGRVSVRVGKERVSGGISLGLLAYRTFDLRISQIGDGKKNTRASCPSSTQQLFWQKDERLGRSLFQRSSRASCYTRVLHLPLRPRPRLAQNTTPKEQTETRSIPFENFVRLAR